MMTGITALAAGAGLTVPQSDYIKVKATMTGTFRDPKIRTDLSGNLGSGGKTAIETVKEAVEEKVTEEIEKVEEKVRDEAGEKAEKIISDAEAEAEQIIEEAKKAGDKLVKEAERQGENLVKEAGSNPLKQMGAKRAAEELKKQAETQSENLVKEAEVKADTIMERARKEAAKI
jgi:cell division septum initiation protein DivIVA